MKTPHFLNVGLGFVHLLLYNILTKCHVCLLFETGSHISQAGLQLAM